MRKRLWMLHSWMGLVSGLGLLLIGLTGSLLVFRTELEVLLKAPAAEEKVVVNPDVRARLDYDTLFQKVRQQMPGREVVAWDTIMFGHGVDAAAVTKAENPREWDWIRVAAATGEVLPDLPESWASPYLEWR
ncbi:PepSY domain-containing protein [Verrucomicrobium spinosum]|uniref:PepSY domain-containing protein n=1 Tax=Verrucomicrobium spinosum TaxID=2736 RepID=UPI0009465BA4|nr:PepSY domain-containing protein [Verrucomicrobium spinosum]